MAMQTRMLGRDLQVSALALGCMGMSEFYGARDDAESLATIERYLDAGGNFLDTSDAYGPHTNEVLVGRALTRRRAQVVLATKFGIVRDPNDPTRRGIDGSPAYAQKACEASLKRLGVDTIDLYYLHRVDATVPIEESVGAMARLVEQGKVRHLGLSEAGPETLRRAHKVHPIAAVQTEYSLWSREPEDDGVLAACRDLNIGFVAYSPLGRGFLTGRYKTLDDLASDDYRRTSPRFMGDNFAKNLELVRAVEDMARDRGCTPSQLALAWLLARHDDVVPLFGTKKRRYLDENLGALAVPLRAAELERLERIAPPGVASGGRYQAHVMPVR